MPYIAAILQEKIGISNYLWAFAGQASTKLKNEEIALTEKLAALTVGSFAACSSRMCGHAPCIYFAH